MPRSHIRRSSGWGAIAILAVTAAGTTRPAAQTPAPIRNTSAISGTVVDGGTGRPIEGAIVVLIRRGGPPVQLAPSTRQLTDAQGRFVFKDLPAGDGYSVGATRYGYLPADYARSELGGAPRRISLAENQWIGNARITMWRPGAISGLVVDEHGDPVVGVFVRALAAIRVAGASHFAAAAPTTTDDRGMYRITGLRAGKYVVSVPVVQSSVPLSATVARVSSTPGFSSMRLEQPVDLLDFDAGVRLASNRYPIPAPGADGRRLAYRQMFYPGTTSLPGATVLDVAFGADLRGIDVRLDPVPVSRVSGTLEGPSDAVANRTLRLLAEGSEDLGDGSETATAITAPDGSFTFVNVPAGTYAIDAKRAVAQFEARSSDAPSLPRPPNPTSGFGMNSRDVDSGPLGITISTVTSGSDEPSFGRARVIVGGQDVSGVTVTLQRAARLSGRLVWEGTPPPMFLFIASAEPANGSPSLGAPRSRPNPVPSDTFAIDGLLPAAYFLRFPSSPWVIKTVAHGGRDYTHTPFDASTGRDFNDVVVTFTDKSAAMAGSVRDRNAQPATTAAVLAFPVEREQWTNFGFTPARFKSAEAGAGAFSIPALPAGDYFVIAVDGALADAWQDPKFLERAAPVATRVTIAWGETKTVDLVQAAIK